LEYTDNLHLIEGKTYYYKIKGVFNTSTSDLSLPESACLSIYTLSSGSWADLTIWSCNRIPTNLDDVIISPNHVLNLETNIIGNAKNLINNGELKFGIGANLILNSQ
jgi:hypothetical protein